MDNDTVVYMLETHGNSILRLSYSYLRNLSDAEDVLQDTLMSYMKSRPDFKSEEHEKAWLLRVAINLSKNRLKSKWFHFLPIPEEHAAVDLVEEESEVMDAVLRLPVKYREVIHLFYYDGYSTAEIAGMLDKNEATVRSLLHRARGLLKKALKGGYDFEE